MKEAHPVADIFPMLPTDELKRLSDDIAVRGLLEPVVLLDDMILDGRNRYAACKLAGVTPDFVTFSGNDALGYVIAKNLHRRHLSESQRAVVAAKIANMKRGGDRPSQSDGNFESANLQIRTDISQHDAATMLNVSPRSVASVKSIERDAPDLLPQIEQGEITVHGALVVMQERESGNGNGHTPVSGQPDYDGNEWYTPVEYLDLARQLMGSIDVDPASCEWAQARVQAATYYTKETDGLSYDWTGSVWLNPPYSFPEVEQFTTKLQQQYEQGITTEAVLLVNNCTDSDWFQQLLQRYPVCFTNGRIKFERPGVDKFATRQGQAFFYLGTDVIGFAEIFGAVGTVLTAMKVYA